MPRIFFAAAPFLFVFLWSTGFIGTKAATLNADPFMYLLVRFALAAVIMAALTALTKSAWAASREGARHAAVSGALLHAGYLGALTYAIALHLPAGVASVLVGLQPLLTGLLSGPLLGERVTVRQWIGLGLGFVGVLLVVLGRPAGAGVFSAAAIVAAVVALLCTTFGTLYQKRFGAGMPLLGGTTTQYVASTLILGAVVLLRGATGHGGSIHWTPAFIVSLAWLVLALSVGAILLLMYLIRELPAAKVSSLMYLVPPLTVLESYLLFGEKLAPIGLAGLLLCVVGVGLAAARTQKS